MPDDPKRSVEADLAAMRVGFGAWVREVDGAAWVDRLTPGRRLSELTLISGDPEPE